MDEVEKLILSLKNGKVHTRCDAAYLLGEKGDARVIPALSQALQDNNKFVRARARESLRHLDVPVEDEVVSPKWRIIGCGIFSSSFALLLGALLPLFQGIPTLCIALPGFAAVAPSNLFEILLHTEKLPGGISTLVNATTWFIIGAIIGRKTEKNSSAILLWIGANVISLMLTVLAL